MGVVYCYELFVMMFREDYYYCLELMGFDILRQLNLDFNSTRYNKWLLVVSLVWLFYFLLVFYSDFLYPNPTLLNTQ